MDKDIKMEHGDSGGRGNFAFLQGFLRYPEQVASFVPSSRFLERRLVRYCEINRAKLVVELGPGTGGTTQAILDAMQPEARLLSIEITPEFVEVLKRHPDPRLLVHLGSAEHVRTILQEHSLGAPDVVVSGIPFSTMPPTMGRRIIGEVWKSLEPGGAFVAYQVRDRVAVLARRLLGEPEVERELFNVPPMRFYRWRKP
ncbi:MAG: methyltransferase domain-containing protein [Desulfurivibrio sp.]|nr:methyltransferase domain-containing protein [Desulfurivibrio sp.]